MKWIRRWREIGYKELWHRHYGGAHEGDKGCQREYDFMQGALIGWRDAYEDARSLKIEAEELLRENGIEPPVDRRFRELQEKWKNHDS